MEKREAGMKPASNLIRIGSGKTDRKSVVDAGYGGRRGFSIRDHPTNDGQAGKFQGRHQIFQARFGTEIPAKS